MEASLFTVDGADGPLELVATEHGYVRVSLGGCHAYLPPSDARGLAGAVGKRADWGDEKLMSIAAMGDGSLWLRIASEECGLTAAQAPIFASVLREMADEAEEKAHE